MSLFLGLMGERTRRRRSPIRAASSQERPARPARSISIGVRGIVAMRSRISAGAPLPCARGCTMPHNELRKLLAPPAPPDSPSDREEDLGRVDDGEGEGVGEKGGAPDGNRPHLQ